MRYHVTGIDHAKGSHMTLDIDAPSKAAAEKRAQSAGMDVQHIREVTTQDQEHARSTHRGEEGGGGLAWAIKLVAIVVAVAIVAVILWPKIRALLQR